MKVSLSIYSYRFSIAYDGATHTTYHHRKAPHDGISIPGTTGGQSPTCRIRPAERQAGGGSHNQAAGDGEPTDHPTHHCHHLRGAGNHIRLRPAGLRHHPNMAVRLRGAAVLGDMHHGAHRAALADRPQASARLADLRKHHRHRYMGSAVLVRMVILKQSGIRIDHGIGPARPADAALPTGQRPI